MNASWLHAQLSRRPSANRTAFSAATPAKIVERDVAYVPNHRHFQPDTPHEKAFSDYLNEMHRTTLNALIMGFGRSFWGYRWVRSEFISRFVLLSYQMLFSTPN